MDCLATDAFATFLNIVMNIVEIVGKEIIVIHAEVGDITWVWVPSQQLWCLV